MMLMHLAEFGISGLWIIPGFCLAMWYSGRHHSWQDRVIWISMILLSSVFSHNFYDSMTNPFIMSFMFLAPNLAVSRSKSNPAVGRRVP
jgi:hypothetical protein